ncbi:MAG: hypothetical protein OFPII_18170 [Osedax symbiont Rs1]|nr:MAG: hypothetical protein OFPII_18170 [Osedax symbiont Rs1]
MFLSAVCQAALAKSPHVRALENNGVRLLGQKINKYQQL